MGGRLHKRWGFALCCFGLAFVSFSLTHSLRILNPRHINWMSGSGDLSSVFIGWNYFRQSDLIQWPLTLNTNYGYPWSRTISFTDTAPLFALPFKYLAQLQQFPFQYTGFQTLVSVYLSTFFAVRIFMYFGMTRLDASIASLLVVNSPVILFRSYFTHYSLNLVWIVFACFYLYLKKRDGQSMFLWAVLFFISLMWMPYLTLYVLIFWLPYIFKATDVRVNKSNFAKVKIVALEGLVVSSSILASLIILGFWYNNSNSSDFGLGYYNANLLSLINPKSSDVSWSRLLPDLPQNSEGQYEGYGFLGLTLILILVYVVAREKFGIIGIASSLFKKYRGLCISLAITFFLSFGFSIAVGNFDIITIHLPVEVKSLLSIFRSSGRLMIPITLMLSMFLLVIFSRQFTGRKLTLSLLLLVLLHLWEVSPGIEAIKGRETVSSISRGQLEYSKLIDRQKPNSIQFIFPENSAYSWKMKLIWEASLRNIPVNDGFFARPNLEKLDELKSAITSDLEKNKIRRGTLYVFYPSVKKEKLSAVFELERDCDSITVENTETILVCQK
jgi:hypothetical protein